MSRVHVRPRADRCPRFDLAAVQTVLEAFGRKSVWSEAADDLTIVRIDHSTPLRVGNAMVLQVREVNRHMPPAILARAKRIAGGSLLDNATRGGAKVGGGPAAATTKPTRDLVLRCGNPPFHVTSM